MKKCNKCGTLVSDDEKICNNCGGESFDAAPDFNTESELNAAPDFDTAPELNGANGGSKPVGGTILQKLSKVLMGIVCGIGALTIFPLLYLLPFTIAYSKMVKKGQKIGIGFKICVLLFVNVFAGISMLCDSSDKSDAPVTKATENADLRKATKILMLIATIIGGFAILPLAWCVPMTIAYFKKVKEGKKVGTGFKICTLIFINIFAGVYMLCDDAADLNGDEKCAESSDAYFFKAENDDMPEPAKAGVAVAFAEEESEEAKAQKRLEAEQKIATKALLFNKIGSILLAAAAVMALVFTVFIGQTVRYIGQVRNADSVSFSYFTDKNLLDYFTVMDDAAIRQMIADKGVYVTEELVNAYRAISVTETVVAIIMTVAVCAFFVLAVLDFIKNLKDGFQKPRMFGAISTVVTYICGAFIFKAINSGELSVIYKIKNRVESTFRMSLGFNTATIIGLVLTLVAVVVALLALLLPDIWRVKKSEIKIKRKADKMRKFAPIAEKIFAGAVAVCALVCVFFASVSTVTMNSKGTAAVYNKNESTGEYELIDYNSEKGDSLTLISLIQKYSLQEEEILYNIEICQSKIRENDTDIDMKIQLENYRTELADTQKLIADALNFGLTTMYVDIALIVFAGALICFVLCGRRIQKGDLLVVIAVASAIFALLGCMIVIFVMTSFSRLEVQVTGIAPFFHLLFSIAALVGCFYARKFLQYNIDNEKGDQKDVAV